MTETEQFILNEILKIQDMKPVPFSIKKKIHSDLEKITQEIKSFDNISDDFINHIAIKKYFTTLEQESYKSENDQYSVLWYKIADYLKNQSIEKLKGVEIALKNYLATTITQDKKNIVDIEVI